MHHVCLTVGAVCAVDLPAVGPEEHVDVLGGRCPDRRLDEANLVTEKGGGEVKGKIVESQEKAVEGQGKAVEGQGKAVEGQGKAVKGQGRAVEGPRGGQ